MVHLSSKAILDYLDEDIGMLVNTLLYDSISAFTSQDQTPLLLKNIAAECIHCLLLASYSNEGEQLLEATTSIIENFYTLIRVQALLALKFQLANGTLTGSINDIKMQFCAPELV